MKKQFDELDENGDGIITFAELKQGMPLGLAPIGGEDPKCSFFPMKNGAFFMVSSWTFPPELEVSSWGNMGNQLELGGFSSASCLIPGRKQQFLLGRVVDRVCGHQMVVLK